MSQGLTEPGRCNLIVISRGYSHRKHRLVLVVAGLEYLECPEKVPPSTRNPILRYARLFARVFDTTGHFGRPTRGRRCEMIAPPPSSNALLVRYLAFPHLRWQPWHAQPTRPAPPSPFAPKTIPSHTYHCSTPTPYSTARHDALSAQISLAAPHRTAPQSPSAGASVRRVRVSISVPHHTPLPRS